MSISQLGVDSDHCWISSEDCCAFEDICALHAHFTESGLARKIAEISKKHHAEPPDSYVLDTTIINVCAKQCVLTERRAIYRP
jgi:hypothetical protein